MATRKRGPISKKVKNLCRNLFSRRISEEDFKKGLREIIEEHGRRYQAIGLAIHKWSMHENERNRKLVWKLADEVDERIRASFIHWTQLYDK